MHGLIALYIGYVIYLVIFLRCKRRDSLYRKVTIVLAVKLLLLTAIYLAFFNHKMGLEERQKHLQSVIINQS